MILEKVIVMDDVSGLADRSDKFASFLTVSRKYGLTSVYIFHTFYHPARQNWQMIMSQTKIFNFFPGSVQPSSIIKILSYFANRYKNNYITNQICYYKRNKKETCFNSFLAVRKKTSSPFEINFSIVKVTDSANRKDVIYSEISDELSDFKNDSIQQTAQRISESVSVETQKTRQTATRTYS